MATMEQHMDYLMHQPEAAGPGQVPGTGYHGLQQQQQQQQHTGGCPRSSPNFPILTPMFPTSTQSSPWPTLVPHARLPASDSFFASGDPSPAAGPGAVQPPFPPNPLIVPSPDAWAPYAFQGYHRPPPYPRLPVPGPPQMSSQFPNHPDQHGQQGDNSSSPMNLTGRSGQPSSTGQPDQPGQPSSRPPIRPAATNATNRNRGASIPSLSDFALPSLHPGSTQPPSASQPAHEPLDGTDPTRSTATAQSSSTALRNARDALARISARRARRGVPAPANPILEPGYTPDSAYGDFANFDHTGLSGFTDPARRSTGPGFFNPATPSTSDRRTSLFERASRDTELDTDPDIDSEDEVMNLVEGLSAHPALADERLRRMAREDHLRAVQIIRGQAPNRRVASRQALNQLQSVDLDSLPEKDRNCIICYNDYGKMSPEGVTESPLRLPKCKHVFGDHCIKKWFSEADSCPYCREKVPSSPQVNQAYRSLQGLIYGARGPPSAAQRSMTVGELEAIQFEAERRAERLLEFRQAGQMAAMGNTSYPTEPTNSISGSFLREPPTTQQASPTNPAFAWSGGQQRSSNLPMVPGYAGTRRQLPVVHTWNGVPATVAERTMAALAEHSPGVRASRARVGAAGE
ncbi:hypothetical protein N0V88_006652 [Collariella sp. IMI 366227]|nr:hypothetical protein N0V88_006652 [Collariella sp. IMI 366227]